MNIFHFRDELIRDYAEYIASFINVRDDGIEEKLKTGVLWPQPLIQLNPSFEPGAIVKDLVSEGVLHQGCADVFRRSKKETGGSGLPLRHPGCLAHRNAPKFGYVGQRYSGSHR
jgi:hypothetical protein